jgi:F0F1-type ATP synthase epsilon subunit
MSEAKLLTVQARAPFEVYYVGNAYTVTATNKVGKFDILPGHADFFSIIDPDSEVIIQTEKEEINIKVSNGIITVKDDTVLLFLNI